MSMPYLLALLVCVALLQPRQLHAQTSPLLDDAQFQALIETTSGEAGLRHFDALLAFSGWSPSEGADQTATYLAEAARRSGLTQIQIDRFPADGTRYFWAFRTEPWWEGYQGRLTLPDGEVIADFNTYRGHLARFSTNVLATTELVDVGAGTSEADYAGKTVRGKLVLASGMLGRVHALAVWTHGAAGVVSYRPRAAQPELVSALQIEPWQGPDGAPPGVAFSVSYAWAKRLQGLLASGPVRLTAHVEAETKAGTYPLVHAEVTGLRPDLPAVWIQAHTNYRNTGGGNNLTGVGATLDLARTLAALVAEGTVPRPLRSIHFVWGPEHTALPYYFHQHPDRIGTVLALLNLDMVGDHQVDSQSILRLYRAPYSNPSFLSDMVEEMFDVVAAGNTISLRNGRLLNFGSRFTRPIVDPEGSQDPFYYKIERFWGPSDHEDLTEASIGIPAVMLNTWPDPYIGTQEDTRARADATQMKRAEVITGAAALLLANATDAHLPALVQNALARARARLAAETRRATATLDGTAPFAEAQNIIAAAYAREHEALHTLTTFATSEQARTYVTAAATRLANEQAAAQDELRRYAGTRSDTLPTGPPGAPAGALVPHRTEAIRGPINFFRGQYGHDWMVRQTGDPGFRDQVRLAARGHYYLYETLNFADGRRTLNEIRDLVGASYGYAPLADIAQYFRLLESVGVIRF